MVSSIFVTLDMLNEVVYSLLVVCCQGLLVSGQLIEFPKLGEELLGVVWDSRYPQAAQGGFFLLVVFGVVPADHPAKDGPLRFEAAV